MTNRPSSPREEQPRLFVAAELPEAWLDAFARLMDEMRAALTADGRTRSLRLRWVRPEGMHLTLKFLGETPAGRLEAVRSALREAVPAPPAVRLQAGSLGSFGGRRAPRVIWIGVEGQTQALAALAQRVDAALAAAGWPREQRPFAPHLTLARLPDSITPLEREAVAAVTGGFTTPRVEAFSIEGVSLMRSYLGPGGARYERLASFPA